MRKRRESRVVEVQRPLVRIVGFEEEDFRVATLGYKPLVPPGISIQWPDRDIAASILQFPAGMLQNSFTVLRIGRGIVSDRAGG